MLYIYKLFFDSRMNETDHAGEGVVEHDESMKYLDKHI